MSDKLEEAEKAAPKKRVTVPDINHRHLAYIYFIESAAYPYRIKIGKTKRLSKRLSALRCASPVGLRVVGLFAGYHRLELMFHKLFADDRAHGEWFNPSERLLRMLEKTKKGRDRRLNRSWAREIFEDCCADDRLMQELDGCYAELEVLDRIDKEIAGADTPEAMQKATLRLFEELNNANV